MPRKVKLHVNVNKINELEFRMGSNIKLLNLEDAKNLKELLNDFIEYTEEWQHYISYFKGYSKKKLKNDLDIYEDHTIKVGTTDFYSIGSNFAVFLDIVYDDSPTRIANNNVAADVVKSMYEQKYGKNHTLEFDPESSYCYVYTKTREEAERFMWWTYTDIIKPTLDKIKKGEK